MKKRLLLNTQRKELHDILVARGVDPGTTRWTNDAKDWTRNAVETLEAGVCHFVFAPDDDGTSSVHFRPSADGGASQGLVNLSWRNVLNLFSAWADRVRDELTQTDPWQQYAAYIPPERLGNSTDNSPFSHQEAEHLARSVHKLREHIKNELPQYHQVAEQFDPQFESLASRAKQGAGRIDWSNQFVGMLISLCMAVSLDKEAASALWKFWVVLADRLLLR